MIKWIKQWCKKREIRRKGEILISLLDGNHKKHR